ncbi:hypothetical protein DY000_02032076 [Brassica cretica]|uniref:Uncharacterized protein n=1 Tax=Brassica cretica TaxID=69181 RepID=A0ABQ7DMD5_BRACR|nr:hypothetical protein DY000_02032076 [Brassica cretica]
MDPRIPYSQSTGYMGLLHSQQGSVCPENSPYETFPSVSQQFPQFSSQETKVDALTLLSDYDTDQKLFRLENMVCELAKSRSTWSFESLVAAMVIVLVFIGLVVVFI